MEPSQHALVNSGGMGASLPLGPLLFIGSFTLFLSWNWGPNRQSQAKEGKKTMSPACLTVGGPKHGAREAAGSKGPRPPSTAVVQVECRGTDTLGSARGPFS